MKGIKPFCKQSTFKKLLIKLAEDSFFSLNNRLIKQINGYPIGGLIAVVLSSIYVCEM